VIAAPRAPVIPCPPIGTVREVPLRRVALAALLAACAPDLDPVASWVEPMDGATGWAGAEPLIVNTPALDVPPDYEIRPLLRVIDLADGGYVDGTTTSTHSGITFEPAEAWLPGRRYAWTLDVPESLPHAPEFGIPEGLAGTAVFDTDPALEVLDGAQHDDSRLCVVLSAKAESESVEVEWTLDDFGPPVPDTLTVLPAEEWADDLLAWGLEPAVDVGCLSLVFVSPGDRFRFWVGDSGPYLVELSELTLGELVAARCRFAEPADEQAEDGEATDTSYVTDDEEAP